MNIGIVLIFLCASVLFLFYERRSTWPDGGRQFGGGGVACLAMGVIAQVARLIILAREGRPPFLDLETALLGLSISWVVLGVIFIVSMRIYLLGIIVAPVAFLTSLAVFLAPPVAVGTRDALTGAISRPGLIFHAFFGYAGYAAFFAASLGGGLFLLQNRLLKKKELGVLFEHLPPLERSARIMAVGVYSGLLLFLLALLSAGLFLRKSVPKELIMGDANIHAVFALWLAGLLTALIALRRGWKRPPVPYLALLLGLLAILSRLLFAFESSLHSFVPLL